MTLTALCQSCGVRGPYLGPLVGVGGCRCGRAGGPETSRPLATPSASAVVIARAPVAAQTPARPPRVRGGKPTELALKKALDEAGFLDDSDGLAVGDGVRYRRRFKFVETRDYEADVGVPSGRLLLECEGGAHRVKKMHLHDCQRSSHAAAEGWRVLRFHLAMIESGEAVALVFRALEWRISR